jgi:hypothetical protein
MGDVGRLQRLLAAACTVYAMGCASATGGSPGDYRLAMGIVAGADVASTETPDVAASAPNFAGLVQTEWPSCPLPGGWDCACTVDADCASGMCTWTGHGSRCTVSCLETCPQDFACKPVPSDTMQLACLWTFAPQCRPCEGDADCGPGGASTVVQGHRCGADHRCAWNCEKDGVCPDGFACQAVPTDHEDLHLCMPASATCPALGLPRT